jgi:hypothetical protein
LGRPRPSRRTTPLRNGGGRNAFLLGAEERSAESASGLLALSHLLKPRHQGLSRRFEGDYMVRYLRPNVVPVGILDDSFSAVVPPDLV